MALPILTKQKFCFRAITADCKTLGTFGSLSHLFMHGGKCGVTTPLAGCNYVVINI